MNITMDILMEWLSAYGLCSVHEKKCGGKFLGARLLYPGITVFNPHYLYVGIEEDLKQIAERQQNVVSLDEVVVICCNYNPITIAEKNYCPNLYLVYEEVDFGLFFNAVEDCFTRFHNWIQKMQHMITNKESIQDIVDASDTILGYPFALIDLTESTIAASKQGASDDPMWTGIKKGHMDNMLLEYDSIQNEQIVEAKGVVQRYSTVSHRNLLTTAVWVNGRAVGFASLHQMHPGMAEFTPCSRALLEIFTRLITQRMELDEFYGISKGLLFESLFKDLLEGRIKEEEIEERADFIGWKYSDRYQMMLISSSDRILKSVVLRQLMGALEQLLLGCKCVCYQKAVVILIEATDWECSYEERYPRLEHWLRAEKLRCAVSNPFCYLADVRESYKKMTAILQYGLQEAENRDRIFFYETQFYFPVLLGDVAGHQRLENLLHPGIRRMQEIFREKPAYLDTLRAYLECERSMTATAERLYLHKNTVIYRIKRLEGELKLDLSDPQLRTQLLFSFQILDYMSTQQ
jgi:sugar diacid utilization regulator